MKLTKTQIREQARTDGELYYFTGQPCNRGHVSNRWVSTGSCVPCAEVRHRNNPVRSLYHGAKARAKKYNYPFNIKEEDLVVPKHCPVLGIPLFHSERTCTDNSPSIDKIVPELGYVKGNIQIISHRANTIKSNATSEELRKVAEWVDSFKA